MSDQPTLYRIVEDLPDPEALIVIDLGENVMGVLVPVEPCEHGNYAPHPVEATVKVISTTIDDLTIKSVMTYVLCDGTPSVDTDE